MNKRKNSIIISALIILYLILFIFIRYEILPIFLILGMCGVLSIFISFFTNAFIKDKDKSRRNKKAFIIFILMVTVLAVFTYWYIEVIGISPPLVPALWSRFLSIALFAGILSSFKEWL